MSDTFYRVDVEYVAPAGAATGREGPAAGALTGLLAGYSGVVTAGPGSWGATVSVAAGDPCAAASAGAAVVVEMAGRAGMPAWPLARAGAVREDVLEAGLGRPSLPEIVSVPEAADVLGVSPQRVRELAATSGDFPQPVYELRTGKLWLREAMEAYAARRPRTPGRPARSAAAASHPPPAARARPRAAALDSSHEPQPACHWRKADAGSADAGDISGLASGLPDADARDVAAVMTSLLTPSAE